MPMGKANLGANFYPKLVQISSELSMKPEDLLAVMISESGLNPSAYEAKFKGSGLIGFMPNTLKGLGYKGNWEDFIKLTGEEQLDYVKKVVQGNMKLNGGPFTSAGQYYVANLWPIGLKLPGVRQGDPHTPILEASPQRAGPNNQYSKKYYDLGYKIDADFESKAYRANPLFDKEKKGSITLGDLIRQTDINKQNPIYQKAIMEMKKDTGYDPKEKTSIMPSGPESIDSILDKYVKMLFSHNTCLKKIYKNSLPNHDILIQIIASDHINAVEFSRILCTALDEDLLSTSYTHTDGNLVEIECSIAGPHKECFAAVKQMAEAVSEVFTDATSKIGGIIVKTNCIIDKKSAYQPISFKTADTNYRKFLLKFI